MAEPSDTSPGRNESGRPDHWRTGNLESGQDLIGDMMLMWAIPALNEDREQPVASDRDDELPS